MQTTNNIRILQTTQNQNSYTTMLEFTAERATLGADPEIDMTPNGNTIAKLRVAVNTNKKVDGEWESETDWYSMAAFGNTADRIIKMNLVKGDSVYVKGGVRTSNKDDKWYTNYNINRIQKLARKDDE